MAQKLELSDKDFKITLICNEPSGKVDNMQEQIGNFSRQMKPEKKN